MQPPKKKVPLDPVTVHVKGLNLQQTSKDCLELYLEKFSNVEVKYVQFGSNDNALALFDRKPGRKAFVLDCSYVLERGLCLVNERIKIKGILFLFLLFA